MGKDITGEGSGLPLNQGGGSKPPLEQGGGSGPPLDPRTARRRQDPIGRRLRQMYDEVVSESVPDDFLGFLEQADERMAGEATGNEPEALSGASRSKP